MPGVYEDYPFKDFSETAAMRCSMNKKIFVLIMPRGEYLWVNVKCDPQWRDFWREAFASVVPGYHMNKNHWNSIILDGTVPDEDIKRMLEESYDLVKPKPKQKKSSRSEES